MSTFREAILALRLGQTVTRAGRTYRYLTEAEAEPILLERTPRRTPRTTTDSKGQHVLALDADGAPIIDTHAPRGFDVRKLGIHELAEDGTVVGTLRLVEEDYAATDWELPADPHPAVAELTRAIFMASIDQAPPDADEPVTKDDLDAPPLAYDPPAPPPEPVADVAPAAAPAVPGIQVFAWIDAEKLNADLAAWRAELEQDGQKITILGTRLEGDHVLVSYSVMGEPVAGDIPFDDAGLRLDGPTPSEWVKAGYPADKYPPQGYAPKADAALSEAGSVEPGSSPTSI